MDCLEFRRHLLAEPNSQDAGFLAHRKVCAECRAAAGRAEGFEQSLKRAFDVPVPDGLADEILLGQTLTARRSRMRNGWFMALAATVLLGIGLTAVLLPTANAGMAKFVVEHIRGEPQALASVARISDEEVRALFAYYGIELTAEIEDVTFAAPCRMYKGNGVHLVVREDEGMPVTYMYMPEVALGERISLNLDGFQGVIMPLARGALAVVGYEGQPLDGAENLMTGALSIGL